MSSDLFKTTQKRVNHRARARHSTAANVRQKEWSLLWCLSLSLILFCDADFILSQNNISVEPEVSLIYLSTVSLGEEL